MWSADLNLVDNPELGLVNEVEDGMWEDFENEGPADGVTPKVPKVLKKLTKPKVHQFVAVTINFSQ